MTQAGILIVEDEGIVARDLKDHLESAGYTVVGTAASGEQAIERAATLLPELILMDVVIKGAMDGIETARRIQERHEIPVVYLTAYTDASTLQRAKQTTCFGYLTKPFRPEEVRATIEVALVKRQMERALWEQKERLRTTLQSIGDGVIAIDAQGRVDYLNPVAEGLTGWPLAQARGLPVDQVLHLIDQSSSERIADPLSYVLGTGSEAKLPPRTVLIARDGGRYPVEDSCTPIRDRDGSITGAVLVFRDVTAHREMLDRITYQARHDPLTGLVNRREFEITLEAQLHNARTSGRAHALLCIDLDRFKIVNDSAGHQAGDELLRRLAALLTQRLRKSDMLARLGGDEFGVLLENCPLDVARQIADGLIHAVSELRFAWQERVFTVGASVGVVAITQESHDASSLMVAADTACYLAKEKGRNQAQVYHADDVDVVRRKGENNWVARIPDALANNRFRLFAQRIAPVECGDRHTGRFFEVLLRLEERPGELIAPAAFLRAAERYNLMPRLDRWVIGAAIDSLGEIRRIGAAPRAREIRYSINLSGNSLSDRSLLSFINQRIEETAVPPHALCFEITETAAISQMAEARKLVSGLKELGCSVALDDFGSGLSSFAYLKNFPVDFLKMDGSFVRGLLSDSLDCALVEGVHRIGQVLGVKTVAEHVEHPAMLTKLRELGVNYAQGYAIHKPEPLLECVGPA